MEKEKGRPFQAGDSGQICAQMRGLQGGVIQCPQPGLGVPRRSRSLLHPPYLRHPAHLLPRGQAAEAANLQDES